MKALLISTLLLASVGTAVAAPLPTHKPCQKILWIWGLNCYQPGAQEDANRTGAANRSTPKGDRLHGSASPASPAAPSADRFSASPQGDTSPAASPQAAPQTADGGGGGVVNPTDGGSGNPPPGGGGNPPDDGGGNPPPGNPGLGNPGNNKAVGHAGENPSGKGFGPTGARGKNH